MGKIFDDIRQYIPQYLTRESQDDIVRALRDFPNNFNYYTSYYQTDFLQGDGWNCLDIVNIYNDELSRVKIRGIILSNSCDASLENVRSLPSKVVFAPILALDAYTKKLSDAGLSDAAIKAKTEAIKKQQVTSIFYLPKGLSLEKDSIAILDDLHSLPLSSVAANKDKIKYFTLSQVGFYLFLLKISIHFCRFQEKVFRDVSPKSHH